MSNTKNEKGQAAKMREIIIDEEFQFLLPPLDSESLQKLEESILKHGCRNPLVLWNGILIDGYNRYRILTYHDLDFNTVDMEFDSREEATIWIIENQIAQRNLNSIQLSYFRGLHYNMDKQLQGTNNQYVQKSEKSERYQNNTFHSGRTRERLAEQYNVSQDTIMRNSRLAKGLTSIGEIEPEIKKDILIGNQRVSKSKLESLASATPEEVEKVVAEMKAGEFVSRAPRGSLSGNDNETLIDRPIASNEPSPFFLPELRKLNNIISDFAGSFNSMMNEIDSDDPAPLKVVLRTYISQLEELYNGL